MHECISSVDVSRGAPRGGRAGGAGRAVNTRAALQTPSASTIIASNVTGHSIILTQTKYLDEQCNYYYNMSLCTSFIQLAKII